MSDGKASRVLLTGATGFVGRQVLRNLPLTHEVHCTTSQAALDEPGAVWHRVDLCDADASAALVADVRPDILIHCAWTTEHGAFWHDPANEDWLEAGKALFDAFKRHGGSRVVACGSCAEYPGDSLQPRREDEVIEPSRVVFPYGRAKLALLDYLRGLDLSFAWVRIFLAYGEGEDPRRLVPSVLRCLARNQPARCSSGTQVRDFIDVRDLGMAIARLAESQVEDVINLGSGYSTTIGDVVTRLARLADRLDLLRLGTLPDRADEPHLLVPDLNRQIEDLGFRPQFTLDQGLADAARLWLADARV